VAPRRLNHTLPRDLETICLRALAKEPRRRYASAHALAEDLRCHLRGDSIWARPAGRVERLQRWCRRRPLAASAILALVLVVAGGLWLQSIRQAWQIETAQGVNLALGKAEQLREQARQIAPENLERAKEAQGLWEKALEAVKGAEGVRAAGLSDEATRQRVEGLSDELLEAVAAATEAVAQRNKELQFALDLERAHLAAGSSREGRWDDQASTAAFEKAFREFGLDVRNSSPDELVRWLDHCPPVLAEPVMTALYAMIGFAKQEADQARLRSVVERVDHDPWRKRFTAALAQKDGALLRELTDEARRKDLPPTDLYRLGHAWQLRGETDRAVELLRLAQRPRPTDFWINMTLGICLVNLKTGGVSLPLNAGIGQPIGQGPNMIR
jgi:serine/threonine-protein kinase